MTREQKIIQKQKELIELTNQYLQTIMNCNMVGRGKRLPLIIKKIKVLESELVALESEPEVSDEEIEKWVCEDTPAGPDAANVIYWKIFGAKSMRDGMIKSK